MSKMLIVSVVLCNLVFADGRVATAQPFPSGGSPNPAMTGVSTARPPAPVVTAAPVPSLSPPPAPAISPAASVPPVASPTLPESITPASTPRAVSVARATAIPRCTSFVDAAATSGGGGTAQSPHKTIAAAVSAAPPGAIICVAEGTYSEQIEPGEKYFTLAGGFQRGTTFTVRDSARYVSKAQGRGGSFFRVEDPGPREGQLTAIDGFEITGYAQAIFRDVYYSQRFDITNNHIHTNKCDDTLVGAGFALNNVSGRIQGNVIRNNMCGRGGAGFVNDSVNKNTVTIANNLIDRNAGTEKNGAHGGALYLFANKLAVTGNTFTNNSVTQWGGGLYVGAIVEGGQTTSATLSWNYYRGNRAGNGGGGLFCDDGALCVSEHEIFDRNCGGNVLFDQGSSGPTVGRVNYMTNVGALEPGCNAPGPGVRIDKGSDGKATDSYSFTNSLFWGNAPGQDFVLGCDANCSRVLKVTVSHSMVQTNYVKSNATIAFGPGIVAPADPLFAAPEQGDFHLKSTAGRWTPTGTVQDPAMSPALAKADPSAPTDKNPARAGKRNELGAYGNSGEASYRQ